MGPETVSYPYATIIVPMLLGVGQLIAWALVASLQPLVALIAIGLASSLLGGGLAGVLIGLFIHLRFSHPAGLGSLIREYGGSVGLIYVFLAGWLLPLDWNGLLWALLCLAVFGTICGTYAYAVARSFLTIHHQRGDRSQS